MIPAIGLALLQALSLISATNTTYITLAISSFIQMLIIALLSIPLQNVLVYGNLNSILLPVRILVYCLLALMAPAITALLVYLFDLLIFTSETSAALTQLLPARILISALLFVISVSVPLKSKLNFDNKTEEPEDATPEEEANESKDNVANLIDHIAVKTGTKIHVVPIDEIICLTADGDYVQVVTAKGKYLKEQTMKYFEEHLPQNKFVRVHRSNIVNTAAISRIELYEKQTQ